jgi:hypothetical protein
MHKLPIIVDKESKSCYIESVETKPQNKIGVHYQPLERGNDEIPVYYE